MALAEALERPTCESRVTPEDLGASQSRAKTTSGSGKLMSCVMTSPIGQVAREHFNLEFPTRFWQQKQHGSGFKKCHLIRVLGGKEREREIKRR